MGVFVNRHLIIFVMRSYNLLDYTADNKQHVPIVTKFILYEKLRSFLHILKSFFHSFNFNSVHNACVFS